MELPARFPSQVWDGLTGNNWRTSRQQDLSPDFEDWDRIAAEVIAVQEALTTPTGGGTPSGTGVAAADAHGVVHRTVLTLTDVEVAMTDADVAGCHGSLKVYDFPAGVIQILGCVQDLTTAAGAGGIADGAALIGSLGTDAAGVDNEVLAGTEADVVPSTAGTLADGAGTLKGTMTAAVMAAAVFDGTTTTGAAKDLHLNLVVPNADSAGDDTITVNGTITLTWINHGDN